MHARDVSEWAAALVELQASHEAERSETRHMLVDVLKTLAAAVTGQVTATNRHFGLLTSLEANMDSLEVHLRMDSGRSGPGPSPEAAATTATSGVVVPVFTSIPETGGEVSLGAAGCSGMEIHTTVRGLIEQVQETTASARNAFAEELRNFKPVEASCWLLPAGYRSRLAPVFLTWIFARFSTGKEYAEDIIRKHGLSECVAAQEIVRTMEHFDRLLTTDRGQNGGWINSPSTEYMARRVLGLTKAFQDCREKEDWFRTPAKSKAWKSKVRWHRCAIIDPKDRSGGREGPRMPEAEAEVRKMEKDEFRRLGWKRRMLKIDKLQTGKGDPLNP